MRINFNELKARLTERLTPGELTELLEIDPKELLEAFEYKIEEKYEDLVEEYGDDEEDSEDPETR